MDRLRTMLPLGRLPTVVYPECRHLRKEPSMEPAGCPAPNELSDFLSGKLPRARTQWIADHVRLCSRCDAALQDLDPATDPLLLALSESTVRQENATAPVPPNLLELARASRQDLPAPVKLGRFEIVGQIGQGAYGTVFKARDTE